MPSKTDGCNPTRIVREGCGNTEPGVYSFVLGTYPQRGSAPPPPPTPPEMKRSISGRLPGESLLG